MSVEKKSIKNDLKFKQLNYTDDFFSLKGDEIVTTDFFSFTPYEALKNPQDVQTNSFSNLVLTKSRLNADWLQSNQKDIKQVDLVTTLAWYSPDPEDKDEPGMWLYFDKNYEFWDVYLTSAPYSFTKGRPLEYIYNYIFFVDFIDETHCRISHNFGDLTFYMSITEDNKIEFVIKPNEGDDVFSYSYDGEKLLLYKIIDGKTRAVKIAQNKDGYYLTTDDKFAIDESTIIYTAQVTLNFDFYVNTSYVGYDRSRSVSGINRKMSAFNLESQNLLHHQYNMEGGVNFVPLKNTANYIGDTARGSNLTISKDTYPDVNYRLYNAIQSGINQELGHDNIILDYYFNDQVYRAHDGEVVEFYIPTPEENRNRNPLWPFIKMNISDTKFVKNGAFATNVPFLADKMKKLQGKHTILIDAAGVRRSPNNATYLCTWLFRRDENNAPMWLDRYYYPDVITRKEALTSPYYSESFDNVMDKNYRTEYNVEKIKQNTYFDKISDLVLEPGNSYAYSRISSAMVSEVIENMEPMLIKTAISNTNDIFSLTDRAVMDNKTWLRIDHKDFNKANKVDFNFDLYLTHGKKIGIQLLGTDYKSGLTISNRKDLSPFHYYATEEIIYMLNNNFELRRSFNLKEKYNEKIIKVILGDVFDDVFVITSANIYMFTYDLQIKAKIKFTDILNIGKVASGVTASNISTIIAQNDSLVFKNNIYVPYGSQIMKIIFVPDKEKDNFTWEERDNYPAKIRMLEELEINYNFIRGTTTGISTDVEMGLENGFIEVENRIKTLHIDKNGDVYGFNFDKIAMSCDGDTMYGVYGWDDYINSGGWFWVYNQSLSKIKSSIKSSKFAEFGSDEAINFVSLSENGYMGLVRNFVEPGKTQPEHYDSKRKRLEIYNKSKMRIYNYDLSAYEQIYSFDSYKYINQDNNEICAFTALAKLGEFLYRVEYQCEFNRVVVTRTELPLNMNPTFKATTNSNTLVRYHGENKLRFNLFLPSNYLYDFTETIEWDLKDIQTGWYNINVAVDLDKAEFVVRVNDKIIGQIRDSEDFLPYVNSNGTIFDTTYYIGCTGKKYGTTMSKILYDTGFDPYACKNTKFENFRIYTKKLEFYEYQAVRMVNKEINTIALTVPCGHRDNIEEIIRYFKYAAPGAIANNVKINISGTGLTTRGEFELLEKEIRLALQDELDCIVDVQQIEFIQT